MDLNLSPMLTFWSRAPYHARGTHGVASLLPPRFSKTRRVPSLKDVFSEGIVEIVAILPPVKVGYICSTDSDYPRAFSYIGTGVFFKT